MIGKKLFCFFLIVLFQLQAEYHSQMGQDRFVHETFFSGKKGGVFVDIGAHDGVSYSNSFFFEKELGWKGICVEPNPQVFAQLKQSRKSICVQACISEKTETAKFLQVSGYSNMLSGLIDKYDSKHLERIDREIAQYGGEKQEIEVPTVTLNELAHRKGFRHIDFLSIDTEGGEYDILKSIDFTDLDIDVIVVENNYHDSSFRHHLQSQGYVLITKLGCDEVYKMPRLEKYTGSGRPSLHYIQQFLPEHPVIVEAGAHEGSDTKLMSHLWKKGKIFAFEPSPDVYKKLKKRVAKRRNIKSFAIALGDRQGTTDFYPSQPAPGAAIKCNAQGSLLPPSESNWRWPEIGFGKPIPVSVTTLDSWAKQEGIEKIDFLWLDMQGSELSMLKASPDILKTVQVIQIEVSRKPFYQNTPPADEVQSWLEAQGFNTVYMTPEDHGDALFVRPSPRFR